LEEFIMSAVTTMSRSAETAAYGGLIDALGGIAAAVLAIIGLTGFDPQGMAGIATIVFGAALLIQGGTILTEYSQIASLSPDGVSLTSLGSEGISAMFLVGAGGIVLGVLSLLNIAPLGLTAIAVIAYGSALLLSSSSVRQLYLMQGNLQSVMAPRSGNELIAGQMATGSTGVQLMAGLASAVLGILAVAGHSPLLLSLAALLLLGVTVLLTGSTLSGLILSFMRPSPTVTRRSPV
jgi:hypothetical protein